MRSASRSVALLRTPQPPRHLPGPRESARIAYSSSRSARPRSCPSTGCDGRPTPKQAVVPLQPSRPLRPPQPPAIQSYHMKIGLVVERRSRPPISRYSRLKAQAMRALRHDLRPDLEDRVHDLLERHQNPVTAIGQRALTTVSSGAITSIGAVEAGVQRQVGEERLRPRDARPRTWCRRPSCRTSRCRDASRRGRRSRGRPRSSS